MSTRPSRLPADTVNFFNRTQAQICPFVCNDDLNVLAGGSRRNRSGTRRARRRCRPAAASTARRRTSLTTTSCVCPPLMSRTALLRVSLSLFLVRLTLCCHYINHCGYLFVVEPLLKAFAFYGLLFGRHAFLTTGMLLHLPFLLKVSIIQTLSLPMMNPLKKER